ncbi:cystathionine gamma-synthase [Robiginitomaculum antarcticum]|uniref:cystathionine gamma-synthase n=1 Tax=Robiginitomaculum antarcticum TaxID=437507 RepID=UPI000368F3D4|nr:cystathionine gamma-synthase [Robiginitomaculum antarcticum]
MTKIPKHPITQTVQAGLGDDPAYAAVVPPLYTSSTYLWDGFEQKGPYDYGRTVNPNRNILAVALAELEGGAGAVITSSGMAALDLILNLLPPNGKVIASHDCYGGSYRLLEARAKQGRIVCDFVDQTDEGALAALLKKGADMVLIETPSNPLMRVVDVAKIAKAGKVAGAILVADNTFLSPARMTPLALGCDIVWHSTTKSLNGHSDVVGGAVIAKTADTAEELAWWANCTGVTGSPFDAAQTLRGLRTLHVRMDAMERNALTLATWLYAHKQVERVYFPGLKSDPGYALAATQQSGPGFMISFDLKGGTDAVAKFVAPLSLFRLAASLGGTESLICHPATMTHRGMGEAAMKVAGIGAGLMRISVGIEHKDDQIADLEQGFSAL